LRLGVLYPPCGAEWEYYRYGEAIAPDLRVALVGVRIFGGDDEHALGHMARTGSIENLELSAGSLAPLEPDAVIWACTSGSFVNGLAHAREQASALERKLDCPATSSSLAFVSALRSLGIARVAVLASYPAATAAAFTAFLGECGIAVESIACLGFDSGPAAAGMGDEQLLERVSRMEVADDGALLVPDTAIPTLHLLDRFASLQSVPVLTANQVSLWQLAGLAGAAIPADVAGVLPSPRAAATASRS